MDIDPLLLFNAPLDYLDYMTSANPEGQYFDRKACGKDLKDVKKGIRECISAFGNSRGGVLVIGIQNDGTIQGLDHLDEKEYNSLIQEKHSLVNHSTKSKEFFAVGKKLLLFHVPESMSGICETIHKSPEAWIREGASCMPITPHQRENLLLERNKKWEQLSPSEFNVQLLNKPIFDLFKRRYLELQDSNYDYNELEFATNIGAVKLELGKPVFTNAGYLFFSNNPASLIPSAQVRFLRYEVESSEWENPGLPNFDRVYDGCLPELLRKIRTFINQGAFFKTYTFRNETQSGLIEEPELPPNAVEEAIVNALIHRDYNIPLPIECVLYKDAFVVSSPGKFLQPGAIPMNFELGEQNLVSFPRNPKIVEWAKIMVDENGQRFVKQLSEGHRTMLRTMLEAKLKAPIFYINGKTRVFLFNNYLEREAKQKNTHPAISGEFCNLFFLTITHTHFAEGTSPRDYMKQFKGLLRDKLANSSWFIDDDFASRLVAHQKDAHLRLDAKLDQYLRLYPAYSFQFHHINNEYYLSIDFDLQTINVTRIDKLFQLGITDLRHRTAQVKYNGGWTMGVIEDCTEFYARVSLPEFEIVTEILSSDVIPRLNRDAVRQLLINAKINFPLEQKIKELSLASRSNSARERAERILGLASVIRQQIFPLAYNGFVVHLANEPMRLHAVQENNQNQSFDLLRLPEPKVQFADNHTEIQISRGLTQFGSFNEKRRDLEIIPLCLQAYEENMRNLLEVLRNGSQSYRGMERTFKIRPSYPAIISKPSADLFLSECERLLEQHPEWIGDKSLPRLFLVHVPEDAYGPYDWHSPYFRIKAFLLSKGIPVQMVDTHTLLDSRYKDLNLSLNIMAKTGGTPWILPGALPDADLFIGLSYTQYKDAAEIYRTMGYANVFNQYGQWEFYKGNTQAFGYEVKHLHLARLVEETLRSLPNLPQNPIIHLHYSSKFNVQDRNFIVEAVKKVRPGAQVVFTWINTGHNIRLFDTRLEGNGSLSRGAYVPMGRRRFYLSTTGYSTIAKSLGTPIMLEANLLQDQADDAPSAARIAVVARHLLALTKLNWASSQSISGEPVTIKYARDIARLSHAFLHSGQDFQLHPVLEHTPWFI
jgi:predicted HTH transcriptional regulator